MTQPGDTPEAPTGAPPASADPTTEDIDNELAQMAARISTASSDTSVNWFLAHDLFTGAPPQTWSTPPKRLRGPGSLCGSRNPDSSAGLGV